MDPLRATFDRLRRKRRAALIPFFMGGDPSVALTGPLLLALQDAGADLIEVGIPFSDPLADGPVIQRASSRALTAGATPRRVLAAVAGVRGRLQVPVVCLSYWNPMAQFSRSARRAPTRPRPSGSVGGNEIRSSLRAFVEAAQASGCAGVIVPDLPLEEQPALREAIGPRAFDAVLLAAPTSPLARLRAIAQASRGFIYYVSVTGTTGARRELPPELSRGLRQLRTVTTKPICVGFGISTREHVAAVARMADGVIVGSALIRRLEEGAPAQAPTRAAAFLKRLRRGVQSS